MKENRWRSSLSIMDLHLSKRGSLAGGHGIGGGSTATVSVGGATGVTTASSRPQSHQEVPLTNNGQSYELIKSTQVRLDATLD